MNTALVTNSVYYLEQSIEQLTKDLTMREFNFVYIREKLPLDDVKLIIQTMPFGDMFKVIVFDISLYSNDDIKKIVALLKSNKHIKALGFYFIKDKLDKIDARLKKVFTTENNFKLETLTKIDTTLVKRFLNEKGIGFLNPELFQFHDNMDIVINDINKISCLDKDILNNDDVVKKYLSDSFDSNVFELIDALLVRDSNNTLKKLNLLLETKNKFELNIVILKQLNLLRFIKNGADNKTASSKEKYSGGKGVPIHPYRFNKLKNANVDINLEFAISELIKNDLIKNFNLELSILKILNQGT